MSINSLNPINPELYVKKAQSTTTAPKELSGFDFNTNSTDSVQITTGKQDKSELREEFGKIKEEQGLIGKGWDFIKNVFNMKNGSDNVQEQIEKYENGEISEQEAKEAIENYKNGQKMSTDVVGDIVSGIVAVGAAALAPVTGGASLLVAGSAGALTKVLIKGTDALASGREYNFKDLGYDLITGSINGAIAPISNGLGGAAGTGVAKALGLEVVENTVKTTGKGMIANLLAKQGASYVAREGSKLSAKVIGAKVLSYGVDMAVDGALSGAADGFSRAIGEGKFEDIKDNTINGALGGLIAAPVIGGSTRLVFGGASFLGRKISNTAQDNIDLAQVATKTGVETQIAKTATASSDEAASTLTRALTFETKDSAIEYLQKSSNPAAKSILKSLTKKTDMPDEVILRRLQGAINLIDNPEYEQALRQIAKNISGEYADAASMNRTMTEILNVLELEPEIIYDTEHSVYKAKLDFGDFSARAKGEDSVFSKLKNKVMGLKGDFPTDEASASLMIGDAHGTRFIIDKSTIDKSQLKGIIGQFTSDEEEIELFTKHILTSQGEIPSDRRELFNQAQKTVLEVMQEEQSGSFAKKIAAAITNDELRVTELHNYAGKSGITYFSDAQVDMIKEAYGEWYNKMYQIAKNNPSQSEFKIVTIDGIEQLQDARGNLFGKKMIIETVSNSKKAVKDSGYTAAQMNIVTKDGILEELQYRGKLVDELAEVEHIAYDIREGKSTVSASDYDEIKAIFKKLGNNYDRYNEYLSDYYLAARRQELGVVAQMPEIEDYLGGILDKNEMQKISISALNELKKQVKQKTQQAKAA